MKKAFIKHLIYIVLLFCFGINDNAFADKIEDVYKDLSVLEKSTKISRRSYVITADKFFKLYSLNPSGKLADEALLGTARTYRRSYERFRIQEDLDKSLRYYRTLQGSFNSRAARDAYLESADVFLSKRDTTSAKYNLNKLIQKYPTSPQAKKARTKLAALEKQTGNTGFKPSVEKPAPVVINQQQNIAQNNIQRVQSPPPTVKKESVKTVSSGVQGVSSQEIVDIKGLRYFSDKDYTRVVIDISNNAQFESHWLKEDPAIKKPPRLMIDITNSNLENSVKREVSIKDGLLSAVRLGYHPKEKITRVVLDSQNVKDFTVFQMSNPSRIVIDVFSSERNKSTTAVASNITTNRKEKEMPAANNRQIPKDITLGAALGLKIKTIVIDAGHGGKDPGAVYSNMKEKDIVLDIARHVRNYLKQDPSLKIYMTRDKDVFIPLEERTAIANKLKADIFISIHANAAKNRKAAGIETFVFNVTNDRAALEVAALENQSTTKSISDLQGILKDILKYSKLEESLSLAGSVQQKTVAATGVPKHQNLGVKQAPFWVLVGATMPSILVETGFLSNKQEAEKLRQAGYRKKVARGIYEGVREYIKKYNGQ